MPFYSQTIEWHGRDGYQKVTVRECSTRLEALQRAYDFAVRAGWTPPRWWQFWRWNDWNYKKLLEQELNK